MFIIRYLKKYFEPIHSTILCLTHLNNHAYHRVLPRNHLPPLQHGSQLPCTYTSPISGSKRHPASSRGNHYRRLLCNKQKWRYLSAIPPPSTNLPSRHVDGRKFTRIPIPSAPASQRKVLGNCLWFPLTQDYCIIRTELTSSRRNNR